MNKPSKYDELMDKVRENIQHEIETQLVEEGREKLREKVKVQVNNIPYKATKEYTGGSFGRQVAEQQLQADRVSDINDYSAAFDHIQARTKESGSSVAPEIVNKDHYAIFFYGEEGSRCREVLKDFLSEANDLKSIQSDGYNAYMYLDDELIDIEHLCCLAHARAKFWYAYEQGSEMDRFFLEKIGALYGREAAVCLPQ